MNAVASHFAPGITTMIRLDHTHVLALFHRYKANTGESRKRALITNACLALEVHAQLEEEIFYPALRRVMGDDDVLQKSQPEHDEMKRLIEDLRGSLAGQGPLTDAVDERFLKLMRAVMHHVADEETHLLPAAERLMGDQLHELGMEMTKRRVELLKPHAGEVMMSTARSFPAGAAAGAMLLTAGAVAIGAMLLSRRSGTGRSRFLGR